MTDRQKNGWNEQNIPPGAFDHILERVSNQFAPNHGSQHYQSGFMPATTPPWTSHANANYSQHNQTPHVMVIDPTLTCVPGAPLNQQMNSTRSYSVSQEQYPEMVGNHSPLLRSSSDLGMRLGQYSVTGFSHCHLDGILDHHSESIDSDAFFTDNSQLPQGHPLHIRNDQNFQHVTTSEAEIIGEQHVPYSNYMEADKDKSYKQTQTHNFASKISNFTATLGTWFSPLDQVRSNYHDNPDVTLDSLSLNSCNLPLRKETSKVILTPQNMHNNVTVASPVNIKPTYSDVLSKTPSQEGKSNSTSTSTSNIKNYPSSNSHQKARGESSAKPGGKSKNRNTNTGRSNSPNITKNNIKQKHEQYPSKVGLDEFYLPENVVNSNCNSYINNLNNSKSYNVETLDKSKKRTSLTPDDSSPIHHYNKATRSDGRKSQEESPTLSDIEKSHCDKLNNHSLSTQQKQTPKRTTYINNNLASFGSNPSKATNSENSNSSYHRKGTAFKDETKLFYDDVGNSSNKNSQSYNNIFNFGVSNNGSRGSSGRSNTGGARNNRSSNNTKGERSKEVQGKKALYKKKKESSPYYPSDLLMAGWSICLLWFGIVVRAGLWLLNLVLDVIQMSFRLFVHFCLQFWASGKLRWKDIKIAISNYWTRFLSYFINKKSSENKKTGKGSTKSNSGLDHNINLPTTGEEAMKRLLACRGKDPYSILGVTHECTDDDIKKYYKRQAFLVHPDKNKQPGAEEAFKILAHAFEIIGEPERREQYDSKLAEEFHLEGAWGELASLLNRLKEKLDEAANTIRCTNCNKRHKRIKLPRPIYAARHCAECQIRHAAREGDIWAESWLMGFRWKYFACMEGAIYDISEWAACQRENLKHLQANTHSVQYRIVSGKKNMAGKNSTPECPTDPELEDFFNNLCREKFGQDFTGGSNQAGAQPMNSTDTRKRKGKKKK